eukprot:452460-Rhodomonas_salina.1
MAGACSVQRAEGGDLSGEGEGVGERRVEEECEEEARHLRLACHPPTPAHTHSHTPSVQA